MERQLILKVIKHRPYCSSGTPHSLAASINTTTPIAIKLFFFIKSPKLFFIMLINNTQFFLNLLIFTKYGIYKLLLTKLMYFLSDACCNSVKFTSLFSSNYYGASVSECAKFFDTPFFRDMLVKVDLTRGL